MFKFVVKVVVVVLAIQAALGYLKKEGIISGEIKINYTAVKEKIFEAIPKEKIAKEVKGLIYQKVKEGIDSRVDQLGTEFSQKLNDVQKDDSEQKMLIHVISDGETLRELSEKYGVSDKVIKKINKIHGDRDLTVGRELLIPFVARSVT
ncbi:MAG: LysM peptidoglycan-binding domain-containing protein [Calditrichaeota bacterium]|nr:LysM peptidoglycan-binding domain-containing protein [Calditrichota bacterium]